MVGHRQIADATFGMFGRSPDHVASFVTGMAMKPDALPAPCAHADNLVRYYRHIRDHDLYVVYAVVPPQAARNPEFYHKQNIPVPTLRVVREEDDGVVISGMKMLATGALYANDIWIGNVIPLAPDQKKEAITCAVPCNAPGLTLWSRRPAVLARHLGIRFPAGLALRRKRQHGAVRGRQGAVGEGVRPRRCAALARHLHQDAEPLLRQSPVERALLVEDAPAARAVQQDRAGDRRRPGSGGARDARQDGGGREHHRRAGARPDQRLRALAGGLRLLQSPLHVCGARLVHAELQQIRRRVARAVRRRRVPDAGRHLGHGRPRARQAVRDLLADAAGRRRHPHEAVQARLGHGRHRSSRAGTCNTRSSMPAPRSSSAIIPTAKPTGPSSTSWSRI